MGLTEVKQELSWEKWLKFNATDGAYPGRKRAGAMAVAMSSGRHGAKSSTFPTVAYFGRCGSRAEQQTNSPTALSKREIRMVGRLS
jgi:hypothetical protein